MIPRSKAAIEDFIVAAAFVVLGTVMPGSLLDKGFEAHIGGIAIGLGIGWLVKSVIFHSKGAVRETK